ncbi:hypothetical protein [Clostridium sp. HBUAS56017]|uniref:hypothetical protein n=1 Tax=Clostridium sp. HBUAS56017 TaxID=2571128 RepID=UPI001177EEFE|nr:hypothetical protein [Clostridium sp. HBUAS56017]
MKIPNSVKIGGRDYQVTRTSRPCDDDTNVDGQIIYDLGTIKIKEGLECTDYINMVFLHEILHGIFDHMAIEQDEELIRKIGKGLYQVIKDNPYIFNTIDEITVSIDDKEMMNTLSENLKTKVIQTINNNEKYKGLI